MTESSYPSDVVSFVTGRRPLLGSFRSVVLVPALTPSAAGLMPESERLGRWLALWDRWFMDALHHARGGVAAHRHLLYDRAVALKLPAMPVSMVAIETVGEACRALALGFELSVPVATDADLEQVTATAERMPMQRLTLRLPADGRAPSPDRWVTALEALCRRSVLEIAGPMARVRELGTSASATLAATTHVYLPPATSDAPPPVDGAGCGLRFAVHVAADGWLYPCRGLVGLPPARLGHVDDDIADTVLGGRPYALDLARLAAAGPGRGPTEATARAGGESGSSTTVVDPGRAAMPAVCLSHRSQVAARSGTVSGRAPAALDDSQ